MAILERDVQLAELRDHLAHAAAGQGRIVFLSGESGSGKTTLVEHFAASLREDVPASILSCDGLNMPGPFGPLFDIAATLGPEVQSLLASQAPRGQLFRAVMTGFQRVGSANLLVGEDAHWTDEATLELVRFLGRRIGVSHTLFILTYREDNLGPYHPLRRVLGDLVNEPSAFRMSLPPLSVEATTSLAAGTGLDPIALHERTGGNPFYVTEIVASGGDTIPATIFDAVLARAAPLDADARAVLDAGAVLGVNFDPDLLEAVIGAPVVDAIDACLAEGVFRPMGDKLAFRHGLAQSVLLEAMSAPRRRSLHRRVLQILERTPSLQTDLAHLSHHADEARDAAAVLRYAPAAAREAASYGAHRQAAEQFARCLRFAGNLPASERATLLEQRSIECYLTGQLDEAIESHTAALALRREIGDPLAEGDTRRWLSRFCWFAGRTEEAELHARAALDLLESQSPGPALAMALSNISQLRMLSHDLDQAVTWGERAIALAGAMGEPSILAHALTNVGTAAMMRSDPKGADLLRQAIALALTHGLDDDAVRARTNLAWRLLEQSHLVETEEALETALAFAFDRDLVAMELYLKAIRARMLLARGDWDWAVDQATSIVDLPGSNPHTRLVALEVLGRVAARRGEDPWPYLDRALEIAEQTRLLMRIGPVRLVRTEAAWLTGDPATAIAEAEGVYRQAVERGDRWLAGALALSLHRSGYRITDLDRLAKPYALEIAGHSVDAAAVWHERGYPLEEARALASTGDPGHLLTSLAITERLGAKPDAARIAQRLRALGVTSIPRGPRAATQANPAQLTDREMELLPLLAAGHSNREIADALYLSPRTVGHHVSAILGKLEITSRSRVSARIVDLGLAFDRPSHLTK